MNDIGPVRPSIHAIMRFVSQLTALTPDEIKGRSRTRMYIRARMAVAHFACREGYTLNQIGAATGTRPLGWLGAGLAETWNTLEYLEAEGVRYVADWKSGDQPFVMEWDGHRIVSIPYSVDLNDITAIGQQHHTSEEFGHMIRRQFDVLYAEGRTTGKVMAIGLHPYIIGVPHRIGHLAEALDYVAKHDDVWFATGTEIIDAFLVQL